MPPVPPANAPTPDTQRGGESSSPRPFNATREWNYIWQHGGQRAWKGGRHYEEAFWKDREAKLLSVFIGHTDEKGQIRDGLTIPYLACRAHMSEREAHRALVVLCDEKAGVIARKKARELGGDQGRYKVNEYRWNLDRLAQYAGKRRADRPVHWDPRCGSSDTASVAVSRGTDHMDRLRAALLEAGFGDDDPTVAMWFRTAEKADAGAFRLRRTEAHTEARRVSYEKRRATQQRVEAELAAVLADLAARPRRAPAPTAPPPATIATVPILTAKQLAEAARTGPAQITIDELLQRQEPGPGKDLLALLARRAGEGHEWSAKTLPRVLERGGRITDKERATLREMRDEEERGGRRGPGVTSRQPIGTYRGPPRARGAG